MSGTENAQAVAIDNTLSFLLISLFVGLFSRWSLTSLSGWKRFKPPFTVMVFVLGMVFSSASNNMGKWGDVIEAARTVHPHLILFVLLPLLVYGDASTMDFHIFYKEKWQCVLLAGPGVFISLFLTGLVVKFFFDYAFSWSEALLLGSVLAATDPVAVVAALEELGAPKKFRTIVEGESLLNDGAAFVMFLIFLDYANGGGKNAGELIEFFFRLALGGPAWGLAVALGVWIWLSLTHNDAFSEIGVVFVGVFVAFFLAEHSLEVSGVLATVTFGLFMAERGKYAISYDVQGAADTLFSTLGFFSNTIIFFLSGTITYTKVFDSDIGSDGKNWGYLILLYFMIHVIRAVTVAILYPLLKRSGYGLTWKEAAVVVYGGLRGAVGLALGILIEVEGSDGHGISEINRNLINFHIGGIVLLTLLINGTTTDIVYEYLELYPSNPYHNAVFKKAMIELETKYIPRAVEVLKKDCYYKNACWDAVMRFVPNFQDAEITKNGHISTPQEQSVHMCFRHLRDHVQRHNTVVSRKGWSPGGVHSRARFIRNKANLKHARVVRHVSGSRGDQAKPQDDQKSSDQKSIASGKSEVDDQVRLALDQHFADAGGMIFAHSLGSMLQRSLMGTADNITSGLQTTQSLDDMNERVASIMLEAAKEDDEDDDHTSSRSTTPVPVRPRGNKISPSPSELQLEALADVNKASSSAAVTPNPKATVKRRASLEARTISADAVDSPQERIQLTRELAELIFNLIRSNYRSQEAEGLLDAEEMVILNAAADAGLEELYVRDFCSRAKDLHAPLTESHKSLQEHMHLPPPVILERLPGALKRLLSFNWVASSIRALIGYHRATHEIAQSFRSKGYSVEASDVLDEAADRAEKLLNHWTHKYPKVSLVVETVLMARIMLHLKKEKVEDLFLHGVLKQEDKEHLVDTLERRDIALEQYRLNPSLLSV